MKESTVAYICLMLAGIALAAIKSDNLSGAFLHGYLSSACFSVAMFIALWFKL